MTLCRTDVLRHCNRLLAYLNSKFGELKELHYMRIEKNCANFLQCLEFFLKCEIYVKKVRLNLCKTCLLHNCNRLLIVLNLNFDSILTC